MPIHSVSAKPIRRYIGVGPFRELPATCSAISSMTGGADKSALARFSLLFEVCLVRMVTLRPQKEDRAARMSPLANLITNVSYAEDAPRMARFLDVSCG
jgi:hypothetical protein